MRVDYTDRLNETLLIPGVNARWFEWYTLDEVIAMITGQVEPDHKHENLNILDLFGVSADGKLTFNGKEIIVGNGVDGEGSYILATQVLETEDRKFLSGSEKKNLAGLKSNVQSQLDILSLLTQKAMKFVGRYNSYKEMTSANPSPIYGDTAFVDNDETQNSASTIYYYQNSQWLRIKKDKSSNGWIASTSAPTDKTVLWLDISTASPIIRWYNGSSWIDISSSIKQIKASSIIQETDLKFVTDRMIEILSSLKVESGDLLFNGNILGGLGTSIIDDTEASYTKVFSSKKTEEALSNKQDSLSYVPENTALKGVKNGYAPLDENNLVPLKHINDLLKHYSFVVDLESERVALKDIKQGDTCYVISTSKEYIYINDWILKTDTYKIHRIPLNKLDAEENPTEHDDSASGYTEGSIWINTNAGYSYICVDSTVGAASWILMGGQVNVSTGQIIPFKYDENSLDRISGQTRFLIPSCDLLNGYVEVAVDGLEQTQDKDYIITTEDGLNYIDFKKGIEPEQIIVGEVYLMGHVGDESDIMRKIIYDTDNDGIVDRAEIANAVHNLRVWMPHTTYLKDSLILKDGLILRAKDNFMTGELFDEQNWLNVFAKPIDLKDLTTDDLEESASRKYVSPENLLDINKIKTIENTVDTHTAQISTQRTDINKNARDIAGLQSIATNTTDRLNKLKFTNLTDTPSSYTAKAILQVNNAGTGLVYNNNPMFPIKKVVCSDNASFTQIESLKFDKLIAQKFDDTTRELTLTPNMASYHLLDMPEVHQHGKILISNGYKSAYELVSTDDLTASKENFSIDILAVNWILDEDTYYYDVLHQLDSTHLILSFVNENKQSLHTLSYKIIDTNTVRIFSKENIFVACTINASLGVKNGYWEFMFDLSKLEYVDDTKIRKDKSYSSYKISNLFDLHAKKDNVYSKTISDTRFALKEFEHKHDNLTCLDHFTEDKEGNVYFNNKKLIYEIVPYTYSESKYVNELAQVLVFDIEAIYRDNALQAIVNSELLISTYGYGEAHVVIYDDRFKVFDQYIAAEDTQRYILGISNKIKVYVTGEVDLKLTVASI